MLIPGHGTLHRVFWGALLTHGRRFRQDGRRGNDALFVLIPDRGRILSLPPFVGTQVPKIAFLDELDVNHVGFIVNTSEAGDGGNHNRMD